VTAVLICRDAEEDSVLGNLSLAVAMRSRHDSVSVVFTGEALHALQRGTFRWSDSFKGREIRTEIITRAEAAGLPLADRARDRRWSDVRALVRHVGAQGDVRLFACPIWSDLLGEQPCPDLEELAQADLVALLSDATTVIGAM
jgi:peroxiredoxin family protein